MTDFYTGFKPRQGRPPTLARQPFDRPPRLDKYLADGQAAVREPFVGITADGTVVPGLFGREKTGVSTRPIQAAAEAFLATLDPAQRAAASLAVDGDGWRSWFVPGPDGMSDWSAVLRQVRALGFTGPLCLSGQYSEPGHDVAALLRGDLTYARGLST